MENSYFKNERNRKVNTMVGPKKVKHSAKSR